MEIQIQPLTKDLKEDYLFLFDNMVHKENPEWSKCYCNDYHFLGDVETCTHAMSRALIIERIENSELQGYLAFFDDRPIGWCNANNRSNYQRLLRDYDLIGGLKDQVCSVVCFLIHPDFRRQGITKMLLDRVISDYSSEGYDHIESYPKKGDTSSRNFNGPIELYKSRDFKIHSENDLYIVMRKRLK